MAARGFKKSAMHNAFTLIEVLVVISIIAILSAILIPAVSQAKSRAQGITCLNNKRQLVMAWHNYAGDFNDYVPPNVGDDKVRDDFNWVSGNAGKNGPEEFNTDILRNSRTALLSSHLAGNIRVYRCPGDRRIGKSQDVADIAPPGRTVPSSRSISMNLAVGTDPAEGAKVAVNGYWLNGEESNSREGPFDTYGRTSDFRNPGPSSTWLIMDEDVFNLNDGAFAVTMVGAFWLDFPGRYHGNSATLCFADAHAEIHKWTSAHIASSRQDERKNPDWVWVRNRTSAFRTQ